MDFNTVWLFLHTNKVAAGAVAGFLAGTAVDRVAFKSWTSFDDAIHYSWKVAAWRGFQGALIGAASAAGVSFI